MSMSCKQLNAVVHNWGLNGKCRNCPVDDREWEVYGPAVMKRLREE